MNTFITGQEENRPPFISDGTCKNFYGWGKGVKKYITLFFNSKKYACVHYLINNIYTFSTLQTSENHSIKGIEEKTSSIGNKGGPLRFQVEGVT